MALVLAATAVFIVVDHGRGNWATLPLPSTFWTGFGIWGVVGAVKDSFKLEPPFSWLILIMVKVFDAAQRHPVKFALIAAFFGLVAILILMALRILH